jgi:hypothetical protein
MTNEQIARLVSEFTQNDGKIQVLTPSRKKVKTWRGKSGAFNRGAKKIGLQDRNFQS